MIEVKTQIIEIIVIYHKFQRYEKHRKSQRKIMIQNDENYRNYR